MPNQPDLTNLYNLLDRLSLNQKRELWDWLGRAIATEEKPATEQPAALDIPQRLNVVVADRRHYEGKTYQHEKRRCGKAACRCSEGNLSKVGHGPYWYAYWKEGGRLRSQYIGKHPPWELE